LDQGSVYPALRHLCFRKSFLATLPVATTIAFNRARGLLAKSVRAVIALTEFQKAQLVRLQVPESKIFVKPNFVRSAEPVPSWEERDLDFLFVGRISEEKGLSVLLDAWRHLGSAGPKLTVIGDGRLRLALEARSTRNVEFIGMRSHGQVLEFMRRARALLFPSICFESFGLAIVEAFSCGIAVLASRIGGIPEIVREGLTGELVEPGNVEAWAQAIRRWMDKPEMVAEMGENARGVFEQFYTPARNIELLLEVYERALT
jgi:glycosyltransferase involved in cell wall biosynthesis